MPGKFNGLTDAEWNFLSRLLPDEKNAVNGKYFSRLTRKLFFPVFEKKAQ